MKVFLFFIILVFPCYVFTRFPNFVYKHDFAKTEYGFVDGEIEDGYSISNLTILNVTIINNSSYKLIFEDYQIQKGNPIIGPAKEIETNQTMLMSFAPTCTEGDVGYNIVYTNPPPAKIPLEFQFFFDSVGMYAYAIGWSGPFRPSFRLKYNFNGNYWLEYLIL